MHFLKNTSADPPPQTKKRKILDGGFLFLFCVTALSGVGVFFQHGAERIAEISLETFVFIGALSPKILAGIFIASALPLLLPTDKVARWIGKDSGLRGVLIACLAGATIPGGPAMIFPLAAGFVAAGADFGAIVAFVTSWSLLGLNRTLIWEFSFFAPEIVWMRWLLCLPIPFILGMLGRELVLKARQ